MYMVFSEVILQWYHQHKRDLPWRGSSDPYQIWLSEIILQQTRVAQGTPYYFAFITEFPTVLHLAKASEEEVLKLWQGLGYYSRARNLHTAAKMVVQEFNGVFPASYKELLKLKGVGDYTASAIASICFNERQAVVDGNVYRVLARYYGIDTPINSTKGIKYFKTLAQELLHKSNVRDYNQGIMEFGALQCAPKNPKCDTCPLNGSCIALKNNLVKTLPIKEKKTKVRTRYFNYLVPLFEDENREQCTTLNQRIGKGIWQNLWEFPLLETETSVDLPALMRLEHSILENSVEQGVYLYNLKPIVHKLSHQHLNTKFWIVRLQEPIKNRIEIKTLNNYPVPVLIDSFIKAFKF